MMDTEGQGERISCSFRDPAGFVFCRGGELFRQINRSYKEEYDHLVESGLHDELVGRGLLIPHEEIPDPAPVPEAGYRVIKPRRVPFISYPYEWCFSQLQAAALATLEIQGRALAAGMSLKDASAYNIQFHSGAPLLVDTLSFERYREGRPWVAYRQFCQHFVAPLALMSRRDFRLGQLLRIHIDGIPLDLASRLLPLRTWFQLPSLLHLHLHAKSQGYFSGRPTTARKDSMTLRSFLGLLDSLRGAIEEMRWIARNTEWADYYDGTNYSAAGFRQKKEIVAGFLKRRRPKMVWDIGANTGLFSRLSDALESEVVSFDIDPAAVDANYRKAREEGRKNILPLLLDLTNPSPNLGWNLCERLSLLERGPAEMVLALALVHHLAISGNVPLPEIARFFSGISKSLIIEFVPKEDSQVRRLLASREDIFDQYDQQAFVRAFERFFVVRESALIENSNRILYLMDNRRYGAS